MEFYCNQIKMILNRLDECLGLDYSLVFFFEVLDFRNLKEDEVIIFPNGRKIKQKKRKYFTKRIKIEKCEYYE